MGNSINPLNKLVFIPPEFQNNYTNLNYEFIKTNRNYSIPYIVINHPKPKKVIIYSHGNNEDIISVKSWCELLSKKLCCTIIVYDYCGYGFNKKQNPHISPNEKMVKKDILDVISHFSKFFPKNNIILYGRSLGSGPTIYGAYKNKDIGGVIIESGFLSTMKTVLNVNFKIWFDMFRNESLIYKIQSPTLFIHGKKDSVVPFYHGIELANKCSNTWGTLWLENASHNNIDQDPFQQHLFFKVNHFINSI